MPLQLQYIAIGDSEPFFSQAVTRSWLSESVGL